ncbi:P-loop containing nucleoside triphosphate hydrolase protein [Cubamyces sp. BRFM 1775]|nr:P-loop containing nucleoside triphosphate hydrolase protein [Cubamyces sp. BRFM 1775]
MSQNAKRKRPRKSAKVKDGSPRQTSLLDAFGIKSASKKTTSAASAVNSENESIGGSELIDVCSSDAELASENIHSDAAPVASSPFPPEDDGRNAGLAAGVSGGSQETPIVIDSSPSASPVAPSKTLPLKPPKPLYSIFASRTRRENRAQSQTPFARAYALPAAPYPDATTQHVRGPQSVFTVSTAPSYHMPRNPQCGDIVVDSLQTRFAPTHAILPLDSGHQAPVDCNPQVRQDTIVPIAHQQIPAISRVFDKSMDSGTEGPTGTSDTSGSLWNDKWRPRRADQVLGNEQAALYLRDWLLALRLYIASKDDQPGLPSTTATKNGKQRSAKKGKAKEARGTKRPRIVREVQKKRRRVDSEEPEEPWIGDEFTDDEVPLEVVLESEGDYVPTKLSRLKRAGIEDSLEAPPSSVPLSSQGEDPPSQLSETEPTIAYVPTRFGDEVYNTILLCGPHGCGKTAAVYACAEELGWDVFEVYPGIGERSGAALNKLIGEVGKNHLVRQTQQQPKIDPPSKPARSKANFFSKRVISDDESEPPSSQTTVPDEEPWEEKIEAPPVISQSIVLLEEVDVLYREDGNFWPALIKIIRECRRPVVLTCNDMSVVPLDILPLQTILHFEPCPTPLAASYLQALSSTEGRPLERSVAERLYESKRPLADDVHFDAAVHPILVPQPIADLRRAINQLQLGDIDGNASGVAVAPSIPGDAEPLDLLRCMAKGIAIGSLVDRGLRRPGEEVLRDLLANSTSPCADDQLGFKHLVAEPEDIDSDIPVTFSTYYWDEAIRAELLSYSSRHNPRPEEMYRDSPDLHPLHVEHCGTLLPVLDHLHVPREQLVRDASSIFVDYEPWIRHMSRLDDAQATQSVALGIFDSGRQTRNSQRIWRYLNLNDHELGILRRTALDS